MWWFSCSVVFDSCNTLDYTLLGSSIHGVSQGRILQWVAISFSRGSSWSRDQTRVSCVAGGLLHCRRILYQLSHPGSPFIYKYGGEHQLYNIDATSQQRGLLTFSLVFSVYSQTFIYFCGKYHSAFVLFAFNHVVIIMLLKCCIFNFTFELFIIALWNKNWICTVALPPVDLLS